MNKVDFDKFQKEMENIRRKIKDISEAKKLIDEKLSQLENGEET